MSKCKDKEISPVQKAIDAVVKTMGLTPGFQCYVDWDKGNLEELAKNIVKCSGKPNAKYALFIKMPIKEERTDAYQPWITLLGSVIRKTNTGIVADLKKVVPEILKHPLFSSPPIKNIDKDALSISPWYELEASSDIDIKDARNIVTAWAKLESLSEVDCPSVFSHLAGGLRPLVFVFDDYNNYIQPNDERADCLTPLQENHIQDTVLELYGCRKTDGKNLEKKAFHSLLNSHCTNLNNLSISCEVRPHKVWISKDGDPLFRQVAEALPFELLESMRGRIGAFLVDLEWKPTIWNVKDSNGNGTDKDWSGMGYRAIDLLSQRFPEIPCFVYTGHWTVEKLQEALAHGAMWCFYKESHHGYAPEKPDQITSLEFERHLREAARMMYGAFPELPFPDQLILDPGESASRLLLKKLGLCLPIDRSAQGKNLQRIVAKLFPNGDEIRPVKVFSAGKSKAQAAFVVRPSRNGITFATRFMKVAPWLEIQREYLAYQRVIRPRLNTYVASIVERPVLAGGIQGEMPLGAIAYSMAGLPEGYADLKPLDELLREQCFSAGVGQQVAQRLHETLEQVLLHLYGAGCEKIKKARRPLWDWLGEVLPPAFTGVLVPMGQLDDGNSNTLAVRSWRQQRYKDNTAWLMAAGDTRNIQKKVTDEKNLSPWNLKGERIKLDGFHLLEIEWDNVGDTGEITLGHPDLGWRVRLRGRADDIRRRFGAIWVRPGLPVEVSVILEKKNREFEKIKRKLRAAFTKTGIDSKLIKEMDDNSQWLDTTIVGADSLPNPFEVFSGKKQIPYSFTITAHQSPVHGDLNLHNILFSGEAGPGWLIDFDRSDLCGMPAFDLAKLEAEIWHHHLFPLLEKLADGMVGKATCCLKLLHAAQTAADADCGSSEMFVSLVRTGKIIKEATDGLLLPVCNLLSVIATIREFGRERLKLDDTELHWALASYFFMATKFASDDQAWRAVFSFYVSARHLSVVAPREKEEENLWDVPFESIRSGGPAAADKQELDGLLIKMTKTPNKLNEFTRAMAKTSDENRFIWSGEKCWDLASTGSITNITPIFGYLWLMVKAQQEKENDTYKVVVPKISSPGASCGTVDILESGGLNFLSDPYAIKEVCRQTGGVLCRQHESLTPVDKALMKRRKETNTMKNVALVYASILAKKIAMGCTHAIVDVKVGRDSKIMAPWMGEDDIAAFVTSGDLGTLFPDVASRFEGLLKSEHMGQDGNVSIQKAGSGKDSISWVKQCPQWDKDKGAEDVPALKEVRWFFTNADMPQCRAIGRQLILLHLDDLILGTYGENLLDEVNTYKQLYKEFLPKICDIEYSDALWKELQDQWRLLKLQLPQWDKFSVKPLFDDLKKWRKEHASLSEINPEDRAKMAFLAQDKFEKGQELVENMDLRMVTLALGPYQPSVREGQTVKRIDAWKLDSFFDWLCGEESLDPEVGIYLYRMPGEKVGNSYEDPFISVCYRPYRTPKREVLERIRNFLSEHVAVETALAGGAVT